MNLSPHSIQLRLAALTAGTVALIGAVLCGIGFLLLRSELESELRTFAVHEAEELGAVIAAFADVDELKIGRERLEPFSQEGGLVSFGVFSWDGDPVLGYAGSERRMPKPWPSGIEAVRSGETPFLHIPGQDGGSSLRSAKEIAGAGGARWIVTTTVTRDGTVAAMERFLVLASFGFLVAVVLSFLGGLVLIGRAIEPVRAMVSDAELIAIDVPGRRLVVPPEGSELRELASLLNSLLARMEETISSLKRFTSNAGHELRTPLMRIRADAETALQSANEDKMSDALASVLEETSELHALVNALLEFARGEDPILLGEPALRLDELVLELGDEARELANMRSIEVHVEVPSHPCWVNGSRLLLSRSIWNVISNALKFTPDGGALTFTLQLVGDELQLEVADSGQGFGAVEPEQLFEPFFKHGVAPHGPPGHGLGLPLSRAIARRHGGDWTAEMGPKAGARFRLTLPQSTESSPESAD